MAFKLNEKTLEPHNGDYIAFLKEIEKGNAKVSGLTVSVNSDMPGMVTVRRANESDQASSSPGFIAKNKNAMPALLRLAGSVIALFGVLFINGIQDHIACVDAMVSDIPIRIFGTPRISFGI